jgi:hypothetical protein
MLEEEQGQPADSHWGEQNWGWDNRDLVKLSPVKKRF